MKRYDYGMLLNDLEMLMSNGAVRAEVLTTSILGRKIPLIRMGEGKRKCFMSEHTTARKA